MAEALVRARLAFQEGTPYSETYGDVYHSAAGGVAQAEYVFLNGNGLPARWAGRERFVILETGFGFGLNFLATWRAWRRDPARCARLHYVAIEKHPFPLQDLRALHERYPGLEEEAAQLHSHWPVLVPGAHRLELDGAISAKWGVSENNRKAKYYEITRQGRKLVELEQKTWSRLSSAVQRVLAR